MDTMVEGQQIFCKCHKVKKLLCHNTVVIKPYFIFSTGLALSLSDVFQDETVTIETVVPFEVSVKFMSTKVCSLYFD